MSATKEPGSFPEKERKPGVEGWTPSTGGRGESTTRINSFPVVGDLGKAVEELELATDDRREEATRISEARARVRRTRTDEDLGVDWVFLRQNSEIYVKKGHFSPKFLM